MKFESKEIINGRIVITVSSKFLFWTRYSKYEASNKITQEFWEWVTFPDAICVGDSLAFQLNKWMQRF